MSDNNFIISGVIKKIENYKSLEMNMKNYAREYVDNIKDFKYIESFKITLADLKREYPEEDFNIKMLNMSNYLLKQVLDYNIEEK